jgi:hypothetical protein
VYSVHAGEYVWMEFKPRFGRAVTVLGGAANGLLRMGDAVIAVLPGPAFRWVIVNEAGDVIEPGGTIEPARSTEPVETIQQPDFTGANYAMKFTRDAKGAWRGQEIARFVRGAGVPVTFGPDLFAVEFDGETVVFSPDGVLGVAECAPN